MKVFTVTVERTEKSLGSIDIEAKNRKEAKLIARRVAGYAVTYGREKTKTVIKSVRQNESAKAK